VATRSGLPYAAPHKPSTQVRRWRIFV